MRRSVILISWWFMTYGTGYNSTYAVIGPFATEDSCNSVREWVGGGKVNPRYTSHCWKY